MQHTSSPCLLSQFFNQGAIYTLQAAPPVRPMQPRSPAAPSLMDLGSSSPSMPQPQPSSRVAPPGHATTASLDSHGQAAAAATAAELWERSAAAQPQQQQPGPWAGTGMSSGFESVLGGRLASLSSVGQAAMESLANGWAAFGERMESVTTVRTLPEQVCWW